MTRVLHPSEILPEREEHHHHGSRPDGAAIGGIYPRHRYHAQWSEMMDQYPFPAEYPASGVL
jgi:hypothetical protein